MNRRSLLKTLGALPLISIVSKFSFAKGAAPANAMTDKEPLGVAMKYKEDANDPSIKTFRADTKAFCNNCAKYNVCNAGDKSCKPLAGKPEALSYAPCEIFSGKQVASKGWCLSWQKKA